MKNSARNLLLTLSVAAVMAACGRDTNDAETLLASAKTFIAKRDSKAAVIQLKNVLQKTPDSAEARFMLGQAQLDSGNAASATVELRRALELKFPPDRVLPVLARALNAERQFKDLTDRYAAVELGEAAAAADLKTSLAVAYAAQAETDKGLAAIAAALKAVPDYPPAVLLQARVKAGAGELDAAMALVDKVIAASPESPDGWQYKGDLLFFGRADPVGAAQAYRKAIELKPDDLPAQSSLISMQLSRRDLTGAAAQIEALRKVAPGNPQTAYFDAQLAFMQQDLKKARDLTQQLLKFAPDSIKVLQLAGAVQLRSGALLEAERSLAKVVQLAPDLPAPRRLLAQTHLQSAQPDKALGVLAPLLSQAEPDSAALALAGEAQLQKGEFDQAEASFARAAQLDPNDTKSRVALALAQVDKGEADAGLAELQTIAAAEKGAKADLALVTLYVRRKDYPMALKAIDSIDAKQQGKPLAATLRGRIGVLRNDPADARRNFERAVQIDPVYMPAVNALATLDLAEKQPERAKGRYDAVLAVDPKNLEALVALAGLRSRAGAPKEEVAGLLANASKLNPAERGPRLLLIELYLKHKDFKAALNTAQDSVVALPDSGELLDALGRAQLAAGDANQAITSFGKLAGLEPQSPQGFMRLAGVQMTLRNLPEAEQNLRRALAVRPDLLQAQQLLIDIALNDQRFDEALQRARSVQKQRPDDVAGLLFEARVEEARKNPAAAAELYRTALKKVPSTEPALKLHSVLVALGKQAEADKLAASWLAAHPDDAVFLSYQGERMIEARQFDAAEREFRRVVALQPDNAAALNNVAWLMAQAKKPGAADTARKALALQPDAPALMDTLAVALAAENRLGDALVVQKQALALAPTSASLRLGLAKLYIQSGDKTAARTELQTLAKLGEQFSAQAEVGELLKTL